MREQAVRFFYPPYWWPAPVREASPQENRPVVLFLDERGRARPEILQAVQDLTLNKTLADKPLPPGSIVIAAVNAGEEYQLTELVRLWCRGSISTSFCRRWKIGSSGLPGRISIRGC